MSKSTNNYSEICDTMERRNTEIQMKREKTTNDTKTKYINKNRYCSASCLCLLHLVGKCDSGDQDRLSSDAGRLRRYREPDCFAGVRFTLAGILVLIFASIKERKVMIPDREILKYAVPVCLAQTVGQYFFFYIGVAHTSGVKGAIITGLGNFIAILLSCLAFRSERMTGRKIAGCVLGFAGVVVINLMGNSLDMGFKLTGEGFILIAQLSYGISTVLINLFSRKVSPVVLSGTQFTMGGIVLTLIGVGMGGHLGNVTAGGVAIIFYLAMVSAVAYTLWSVLLAWNDVSKVAIFGFVNPLCSVILSALMLGEVKQAFNIGSLIALILVCTGIYIVNCKKKMSR